MHQTVEFVAGINYGSGSMITMYSNTWFSISPFRYIRIKSGGTYDGALLQVYIDANSPVVQAFMYDNTQSSGWVMKDWVADGTDPGGTNNFAALTTISRLVDLDSAGVGGLVIGDSGGLSTTSIASVRTITGAAGGIIESTDSWLRINTNSPHSSGVYFGTSVVRTDGSFRLGYNGNCLSEGVS